MKNKLSAMKKKNQRLFDKMKELKTKVECLDEKKEIDFALDYFDKYCIEEEISQNNSSRI